MNKILYLFTDHDLAHSPMDRKDCCGADADDETCIPFTIPKDDPYYSKPSINKTCENMVRTLASPDINCELDSDAQQVKNN